MNTAHLKTTLKPLDPAAAVRADSQVMTETLGQILSLAHDRPQKQPWRLTRPGWLIALPATAAVAITAAFLLDPTTKEANALSFTKDGDHIDVRIVIPNADPERYRKEFKAHGLTVDLEVAPASPSLAGTLISADEGIDGLGRAPRIQPLRGERDCGRMWCMDGIRIPSDIRTNIKLIFGRKANPGEKYKFVGDATAPGEPLAGLPQNATVAQARQLAKARNIKIRKCQTLVSTGATESSMEDLKTPPSKIPATWYVTDAFTASPTSADLAVASSPN